MGYFLKSDAISLGVLADVFTGALKARGVRIDKRTVVSALLPAIKQLQEKGVLTPMRTAEAQTFQIVNGPVATPLTLTQELKRLAARGIDYSVTVSRQAEQAASLFHKPFPAKTVATLLLSQFVDCVPNVEEAMKLQFGNGNYHLVVTDSQEEFVKEFNVKIGG